jgi:hypothetical protein
MKLIQKLLQSKQNETPKLFQINRLTTKINQAWVQVMLVTLLVDRLQQIFSLNRFCKNQNP